MKRQEVILLPLDGMLVHRRSLPRNFVWFPQQFTGTHLYTWVERGTVRVKCLAQEHNTMSPAKARTGTARSRVECINHGPPCLPQKDLYTYSSYMIYELCGNCLKYIQLFEPCCLNILEWVAPRRITKMGCGLYVCALNFRSRGLCKTLGRDILLFF